MRPARHLPVRRLGPEAAIGELHHPLQDWQLSSEIFRYKSLQASCQVGLLGWVQSGIYCIEIYCIRNR